MELTPSSLIEALDRARAKIRKAPGKQIANQALKKEVRETVEQYFQILRPSLDGHGHLTETAVELDKVLKSLIELTHKRGAKTTYITKLTSAKKLLVALDAEFMSRSTTEGTNSLYDTTDQLIVETLDSILPFAAKSYQQALQDLQSSDRLSYRGPATDMREALRETLDYLAPDKDVKAMDGYKQVKDVSGPTMKQKVQYILKLRERSRAQIGPTASAVELVDEMIGQFVRSVYTRSNISTHTPTDRDEVLRLRHYVRLALIEILAIRI
ncbi:MAG: hypothetical protein KZQ93_20255 [Candidatus Thiodiazotropha sp. (ex Monitilora ramsayi)]|nr:hypothetical protein [Candidatus Thiodiazotropha sp. (ex Monitilora ramsayi)]